MWWGPSRNLTNKNSAGARACAQVMGNFNQVHLSIIAGSLESAN